MSSIRTSTVCHSPSTVAKRVQNESPPIPLEVRAPKMYVRPSPLTRSWIVSAPASAPSARPQRIEEKPPLFSSEVTPSKIIAPSA